MVYPVHVNVHTFHYLNIRFFNLVYVTKTLADDVYNGNCMLFAPHFYLFTNILYSKIFSTIFQNLLCKKVTKLKQYIWTTNKLPVR